MRGEKTNKRNDEGNAILLHCNCTAWFDNIIPLVFVVLGWEPSAFSFIDTCGCSQLLEPVTHLLLSALLPRSFDSSKGLCLTWRRGNGGINGLDVYNLYTLPDLTKCVSADPFPGGSLCVCAQRSDEVSQSPLSHGDRKTHRPVLLFSISAFFPLDISVCVDLRAVHQEALSE